MNQLIREDHSGERLQHEIDKILLRASVVTGQFMGLISLLFFEAIDDRPEPKVAWFSFGMAFLFTMLIWMFNIYINNRRGLSFVYQFINPDYEFIIRVLICLLISEGMIRIWTVLDVFYQMENTGTSNFPAVLQVRGLLIVAFSLLTTWGIEKALAQQQAMGLITRLKEENFQAKYEVLKQQINPHFLFNSLNILKGMIRTGNEDAEEYLIKLADVYRYILQSNAKQDVAMSDELLLLESYHFMLKNRFRDAIDLTITLSPETRRSVLPPLTFQMLMENCVKHNVLTQSRKLYVSVTEQDGIVAFRNNLQLKQSLQSSTHVGLENLTRRYEHLCGTPLRIEQDEQFFTVYLPIIPPDHDRAYS
ncbi:histidine kinase [Spirosoma sp. BT702]|uniref:Histidine kinase n=1 Tax=Spirosoma profusum TaxID=2771354 RepID=A0A926Y3A8_9BACT|nr:histidine kinase [Spirosoma profusum]MBD2701690.1 histidine kinase [Spirosoma profusum]